MSNPPPPGANTILGLVVVLALSAGVAAFGLRRTRRDWPAIGALATLACGFALAYDQFLPDDSYITYRYAANLLQGHGLVFNPGEYVLSTTTPLYTLLLAAAGVFWSDLPVTSHVLSVAALFAGALLIYLLCARHGKPVAGLLAGALYILNPLTAAVYSSESILHVALIFGALYAYDQDHLEGALALSALAVVNRADGALVAIALGLHWLLAGRWHTGGRRAVRGVAVYAGIAVPWYLFAWAYYGSPAPATLGAKVTQGTLPGAELFGPGLGFWWAQYAADSAAYWLIPPLALLGLLLVFPRGGDRWTAPALLWGGLYTAGYTLLGVTRYQNYYTPLAPLLLLLAMLGAGWVAAMLAHLVAGPTRRMAGIVMSTNLPRATRPDGVAGIVVLALGVVIASGFWATGSTKVFPRLPQARAVVYEDIGRWLAAETPPSASVGMFEVGTVGYYAGRRIVDFYGLIQPEVNAHLADLTWAPQHYQPDYVVIHPAWYYARLGPWFAAHYQPVQSFTYARCDCSPMVLYARK